VCDFPAEAGEANDGATKAWRKGGNKRQKTKKAFLCAFAPKFSDRPPPRSSSASAGSPPL
jgi:hypothetical protein